MVFKPLLKEKEINKEKGVILEEINMREDMPMAKVSEDFESLVYSKTSLGRDVIGFRKTVKAMRRTDFIAYRQKWYKPSKIVLTVDGGIAKNQKLKTKNLIEKYFSQHYLNQDTAVIDSKQKPFIFNQEKPALSLF